MNDAKAVAARFVAAMNQVFAKGNATALDDLVAAKYVDHTPSPTPSGGVSAPDLAGMKASFEAVHRVFPGATVTVDELIVEGDRAALLVTFDGMMGPDSRTIGSIILRVEDGKVAESWNFEAGGTARMQPKFATAPER